MGLDVTHYMLNHSPNNEGRQIIIDDWDLDCNVPLQYYSKYITDVWEYDFNKTIAIVENEQVLENLKKCESFNEMDYMEVFVASLEGKMRTDLASYIRNQKLDMLEKSGSKITHDGIEYSEVSFGERVMKKGFFYDEVGSQYKGMNNVFYDTFKKYIFWGEKKDFDLAFECVGGDYYKDSWSQEAHDRLKANFKANFVDEFVFGQSIICVSF